MIINMLNNVINKINIYYKINEDIINNYNEKYRNYETIYQLNQFQISNVTKELNQIAYFIYKMSTFGPTEKGGLLK